MVFDEIELEDPGEKRDKTCFLAAILDAIFYYKCKYELIIKEKNMIHCL